MSESRDEKPIEYHPEFDTQDADVILRTDDGPRFKVHSLLLRTASSHFADVLSLPAPAAAPERPILLHLPESNQTIEAMLRFVAHRPVPSATLSSFPSFLSLVEAGVKYGMEGMISILKAFALESIELRKNPLLLYRLASLYQWHEQRRSITMRCLSKNPSSQEVLRALKDIYVEDYSCLVLLANKRYESLRAFMSGPTFAMNKPRECKCRSCIGFYDDSSWHLFRIRLLDEFRNGPDGSTFNQLFVESWPETIAMRNSYHQVATAKQYVWEVIWKETKRCLDGLPTSL
ncbi:hypothetical protein DL93DRAFT_2144860 [Clavulina sp. PMI_390]|nr:hypothetical protein DL93DRAFT_2144860 [Clavulina sp. PMI_390]